MKIKLNTGISVRTGPNNSDGSVPTRRVGEAGDVIDLADVPEWNDEVPAWLIEDGKVEIVEGEAKDEPVITEE